jgi:hypothetical protein
LRYMPSMMDSGICPAPPPSSLSVAFFMKGHYEVGLLL